MKKNIHIIILSFLFSFILWISISLSNDYYATVKIPVKVTDFHPGYATSTPIPKDISVKLKGKGWKLITVNLGSESDYLIPAGSDSGWKNVNLYNYLAENQWLSSDVEVIDIAPDTLSFFVEREISKKVKIQPEVELNFKPGYGLASSIKISPESTIVFGPISTVENLSSIPLESFEFNDLDQKTIEQVPLKEIPGLSYSHTKTQVQLDVQKIVDKSFDNIPVSILDVPRDRDVVLLPNKISIGLRGGIDILAKVTDDSLNAQVFYKDVVLDTLGSVAPQVKIPSNVKLLFIKPERLRYVIKKFN